MELFRATLVCQTIMNIGIDLFDSARSWYQEKKKKRARLNRNRNGKVTKDAAKRTFQLSEFELTKLIGKGAYGKVFLSKEIDNGKFYAMKVLTKENILRKGNMAKVLTERNVLALGSSFPYMTHLHSTFTTSSHLFFVMEYVSGGDLYHHLQLSQKFHWKRARLYAAEISAALQFLHSNGIVYRDLKLENILLDSDGHCKLADFGICQENIVPGVSMADSLSGTYEYMAPEIIQRQKYSFFVDWWSYGVLCYEMLTGKLPFSSYCNEQDLMWSILYQCIRYPWDMDVNTVNFLDALLTRDPEHRLGCIEETHPIRKHEFFEGIDWTKVDNKELEPPFKPKVLSESDSSNFDTNIITEPARLTLPDPALVETFNQEVFSGFTFTSPSYHQMS